MNLEIISSIFALTLLIHPSREIAYFTSTGVLDFRLLISSSWIGGSGCRQRICRRRSGSRWWITTGGSCVGVGSTNGWRPCTVMFTSRLLAVVGGILPEDLVVSIVGKMLSRSSRRSWSRCWSCGDCCCGCRASCDTLLGGSLSRKNTGKRIDLICFRYMRSQ